MTDGGRFGILDGGGIEIDADDAILDIPALLLVGLLDILGTCVDENGLKENETVDLLWTLEILSKSQSRALTVYVFYHVARSALGGVLMSGSGRYHLSAFLFADYYRHHASMYDDRPFELVIFRVQPH